MKKSTFMIALGTAFACAVLQTRPAQANAVPKAIMNVDFFI